MTPAPVPIAFCITDLDVGGAERCLVELVTRLDRGRWEPRVYCLGPRGELADVLKARGLPVICLGARGLRDAAVVWRLSRELRKTRPRLLQTFLFHANIAGRLAGRLAGVPVIVSGIRVAEREQRWHLSVDRWTQAMVSHNVCVSRAVAEFSRQALRVRRDKLTVITNGVDVERFAGAQPADLSRFGIPHGAATLLSVGRLHRQKGHDLLLEVIAPLLRVQADLHVLIVGEGDLRRQLERTADGMEGGERIHFLGRRSDVPELMRAATLLVHPARWEGMPNVILEAMAAGLPVVAGRVEGVDELVADGQSGLLVNPNSADDLRSAVSRLLADGRLRTTMGSVSQDIVRKDLTLDKMAGDHEALYVRLLGLHN